MRDDVEFGLFRKPSEKIRCILLGRLAHREVVERINAISVDGRNCAEKIPAARGLACSPAPEMRPPRWKMFREEAAGSGP
jgi:hypothetical protein